MKVYDKHVLHVSITHVTIFKEKHYKLSIHRNITQVFEAVHKYFDVFVHYNEPLMFYICELMQKHL